MSTQMLEINKDSYVAFDATSLRDLIVQRLSNNNTFTDQIYVGSNISTVIEIISYSFSTLMYYLNKTASESMFTEAQLYENMNRIVKLIGYKPIGYQSASADITLSAVDINAGVYNIPKYSQLSLGDIVYTFPTNFTFEKKVDTDLELIPAASNIRVVQGRCFEYPQYIATGDANETIILSVSDELLIDNNNIDVYVRDVNTGVWYLWEKTDNILNKISDDLVYELRFNEKKLYELTFGDDINGKRLNTGDIVSIFYISSSGAAGEIPAAYLSAAILIPFNSPNYTNIVDVDLNDANTIIQNSATNLLFNNSTPSTEFCTFETVDEIRKKASSSFKSQGRLVTVEDYTSYISARYSSYIKDIRVKSNIEYLDEYIKHFYNLGLSNPYIESRVLHNQVLYSNANNINNIYVFCLPRSGINTYISPLQKSLILEDVNNMKCITSNIVFADPIYVKADIAVKSNDNTSTITDIGNTTIYVERDTNSNKSKEFIKESINSIIQDYFANVSSSFESYIDLLQINNNILSLQGVKRIYCKNNMTGVSVEGLSLVVWSEVYPADVMYSSHNVRLPYFKVVSYNTNQNLLDRINVI